MLKTLALAGAAAFLVTGAAAAQKMEPTHEFLAKAGASDKFEITEAKLVEARSHNPKLRKFAAKMIHDHTQSSMKLKMAGEKAMGHKLKPPMLMPDQQQMVADLKAAPRSEFDKTYVTQQVSAHQQALSLMTDYSKTNDYPKIAMTAGKIVPVVQRHLDMLNDMQSHMQ